MKIAPLYQGAPVSAEGIVVRTAEGFGLLPESHWAPPVSDVSTMLFGLDVVVPVSGDVGHVGAVLAEPVRVAGTWEGTSILLHELARGEVLVVERPPRYGLLRERPADVVGPAGELEERLLADGAITGRLAYGDGTLHVVTDDVALATRLLEPLYGDRLRVEPAVFSRAQRRVAKAAMQAAMELDIVCSFGSGPRDDDDRPAEEVHLLEAMWVTEELADLLAPVADGLIRFTSHVTVTSS